MLIITILRNKIMKSFPKSFSLLMISLLGSSSVWAATTSINACSDLINMQQNLSGQYVLAKDIDCTGYKFNPIGSMNTPFTGTLDGNNHIIKYLYFSLANTDYVGLFGVTDGATISNLQIAGPMVWGESFVGGLIGMGKNTTINSVSIYPGDMSQASITGTSGKDASGNPHQSLGGLAGALSNSVVNNSHSSVNTMAQSGNNAIYYYVGGLVGKIENTTISASSSTSGNTVGTGGSFSVGGLVGKMQNSTVKKCYSSIKVNPLYYNWGSPHNVGGLIGELDTTAGGKSLVSNSYSSSPVNSISNGPVINSGGLVGYINSAAKNCNDPNSSTLIENSYSKSYVTGGTNIGGLIGQVVGYITLQNNYSVGQLYSIQFSPAPEGFGGLVGMIPYPSSTMPVCTISSYWNTDTEKGDGLGSNAGVGKTSSQMTDKNTYVGWDFTNIWGQNYTSDYPCLRGMSCYW
jgi:hypothetical protein